MSTARLLADFGSMRALKRRLAFRELKAEREHEAWEAARAASEDRRAAGRPFGKKAPPVQPAYGKTGNKVWDKLMSGLRGG